jgi:hypothetical protein
MSAILDYVANSASETYHQTVDFWSGDNSASNAVDALAWGVTNPTEVTKAIGQNVVNNVTDQAKALTTDTKAVGTAVADVASSVAFSALKWLGIGVFVIGSTYILIQYGSEKAKKAGRK